MLPKMIHAKLLELSAKDGAKCLVFFLLGVLIALLAWTAGVTAIAALLPIAWWQTRTFNQAGYLAVGYYLAGSWVIPGSATAFFGEANSWLLGLVLWYASSLLLALPWALLRRFNHAGLLVALAIVSLPPLGLIGWLNPALAAADLFPGQGLLALFGILALWLLSSSRKLLAAGTVIAALLSGVSYYLYTPATLPASWQAVETHLGKYPSTIAEQAIRQTRLANIASLALSKGHEVVLLPEQVAGWFTPAMKKVWENELYFSQTNPNQMLLFGAENPIDDRRYANSLMVWMGAELLGSVGARQAVPVSMWRPYASSGTHAPADWFKTNRLKVPLGGKPVTTVAVFCYEEYLVFPLLSSLVIEKPYAIISVVNGWWASPAEHKLQTQHIQAWAKIFNLPLLRAVNH